MTPDKKEILSFQQRAREIEQEKVLKEKKRQAKKQVKIRQQRRLVFERLVAPILLIITALISALVIWTY